MAPVLGLRKEGNPHQQTDLPEMRQRGSPSRLRPAGWPICEGEAESRDLRARARFASPLTQLEVRADMTYDCDDAWRRDRRTNVDSRDPLWRLAAP